jgi:fucose 4-O-acetylase-like acetyltransferase
MNEKKINRYDWLDIAKAIGIFLIVFSHLAISKYTADFLWTFHVPLFFFISGFLFKPTTNEVFLTRLKSRLVLPYIYIYLLNVLLVILINQDFNIDSIIDRVIGLFWGTHAYPHFVNGALWFLPGLITIELIYFFLIRKSILFYLPLLALSIFFYTQGYLNLFFSIDLALLGLNYYILGILVRKFNLIDKLKMKPVMIVLIFIMSLLATFKFADWGNVWYGGKFYLTSLTGGIMGIMMTISLALLLENYLKFSFITFISSNTLFIFCFHKFSNAFVGSMIGKSFIDIPLLNSLLIATLSILLLIPFNIVVIKYIPQLIGLKKSPPINS